ncbi:MAG: TolC family protein, partial [Bacteroidota bacterium]
MNQALYAQQIWTLQQCIDQALQNNIAIKQRMYNLKSSEADLLQSKINILPSINGQLTNNFNTGFSINPVTNQTLS